MTWRSIAAMVAFAVIDVVLIAWFWLTDRRQLKEHDDRGRR